MTIARTSFLTLLFFSSAHVFAGADQIDAIHRTNADNFKDRALAACMSVAYKGSPAGDDASISTSAFIEWTYYDDKADVAVDKLIEKYLGRDYSNPVEGYAGARFNTLKCLDLYHSRELGDLVRRYVPHPNWIGDKPASRK